ncbi:MAG: tetratricopeptide repeat protein [Gemmataceae bacterium]
MRWLQSEYILKGVYLGLLLYVALQQPDWGAVGIVAALTFGGLVIALTIAAARKLREGYRIRGQLPAFVLFLLLESPVLVYAGVLLGMLFGAIAVGQPERRYLLIPTALGGGGAGFLFSLLREVRDKWMRFGLCLALAAGAVGGALAWFQYQDQLVTQPEIFAVHLLLGIPFFYLLTFAGQAEESEVEIAAMCAALGIGIYLLKVTPNIQALGFLIPIMIYYAYATRVLPNLRVFKYVMRALSYAKVGRYRQALLALRRALQLDPKNRLAREALWGVHRSMDLSLAARDPDVLALMDLDMCLERAGALLMTQPTAAQREEAQRLLGLVAQQRPAMLPAVRYWRAVAHTHAGQLDQAAQELEALLDPTRNDPNDPHRNAYLYSAWQLALVLHKDLNQRVGAPQLALPGRRLEAIAAVERHIADNPNDKACWDVKRLLYANLTEADYEAARGDQPAVALFDHDYTQQLGLALVHDPARWQRGVEYLRIAVHGLPRLAAALWIEMAKAYEKAGDQEHMWQCYEQAKQAGADADPKTLSDDDRHAFFGVVKMLAERAAERNDLTAAIDNYRLYTEYERSGLETLRTLTALYEKKENILAALWYNEQALIYDPKNKELLERKDKYYYSLQPEVLQAKLELVRNAFDVEYCLKKARSALTARELNLELVDWAEHLLKLAQIVQPERIPLRVLNARAHQFRGEKDEALALLEDIYNNKPEKFPSSEDEEAWYEACRLLGEMYLYERTRPDLAVSCFNDYRNFSKSGADTWYKLGQCYEQLGDYDKAVKCYKHVTIFDNHPLTPDARDAIYRLQSS